jgi:hypothetical protein
MKKLIQTTIVLLSINFSFAQTDLVKKKIIEKYNIKKFEVVEQAGDSIVNYLIKFPDGSFKIFDSSRNELLPDHFKEYPTDNYTYFKIYKFRSRINTINITSIFIYFRYWWCWYR